MSEAHANQMLYLLGFVGFLLIVIIGVIAMSQFKRRKNAQTEKPAELPPHLQPLPESRRPATREGILPTEGVDQLLKVIVKNTQPEPAIETNLKNALKKTEENFFGRLRKAFGHEDKKQVLDEVEEVLYTSDLGPSTVQKLLDVVDTELSSKEMKDVERVKFALKEQMLDILKDHHSDDLTPKLVSELLKPVTDGPTVLMIVGVNGAGKTTSIGKMAAQLVSQNFKVLVAAGDTFRAAAGGQLKEWTLRAQAATPLSRGEVEIFWPENTNDPSAVAFDAVTKAKAQNYDFVILDTAGRLHTQAHLMEELKKVKRVMMKVIAEAPHETWIVLDANSGQNALMQAKEFHQALGLTGVIMTKMDGTAKGGVALGVVDQIHIPIKLVGIGEKINDLKSFNYTEYVDSILGY